MFQTFDAPTSPDQGPPRLALLRQEMADADVDVFLVPRADAHQGEYVAPSDERLAWLTGFTGSAGFAAVTAKEAGVFIDGRYTVQVRAQVARDFTPVDWPATQAGPWLKSRLSEGAKVAFDPWLHTAQDIERLKKDLGTDIVVEPIANLVDKIWTDRPPAPSEPAEAYPAEFAGETSGEKRQRMAKLLKEAGHKAAFLSLPDSICWLLNIRGRDIPRNPVMQAFAILHDDATVTLFVDLAKTEALGPDPSITQLKPDALLAELAQLEGPVRVDKATAPMAVSLALNDAGIEVAWGDDPCILAKAQKTDAEIASTREAHLRDGAAMVEFLCWLDKEALTGTLTEIDVVRALEGFRRATNALRDISFDTISGAGPNGAIVHYRVTEETNRRVEANSLLLVDSGGQYLDGTTDITRTIAIGTPPQEACEAFTLVLEGMIAISRARFPRGLSGRDLDALARAPLWRRGMDYDHGTGHGVGVYMNVHEGPQRLSRVSEVPLKPGMILSNEPGYYREGAFGIRIENLIVVREAQKIGDERDQLDFETLTYVPIDRRLILANELHPHDRKALNDYHELVLEKIGPRVSPEALDWLKDATRPI